MTTATKNTETYSLTDYASDKRHMAFVCTCKECGSALTPYVTPQAWLDIAFVLMDTDLLTRKQFKQMHHLACTQWDIIEPMVAESIIKPIIIK